MPEIQDIFEDIIIPSNGHELAPLQTKYWKCITERDYEDAIGICEEILQKEKLFINIFRIFIAQAKKSQRRTAQSFPPRDHN